MLSTLAGNDTSGIGWQMNMKEKIARKLAEINGFEPDSLVSPGIPLVMNGLCVVPPKEFCSKAWEAYLGTATVILQTMLKPTDEMTNDFTANYECYICGGHIEVYNLMIQRALDEK